MEDLLSCLTRSNELRTVGQSSLMWSEDQRTWLLTTSIMLKVFRRVTNIGSDTELSTLLGLLAGVLSLRWFRRSLLQDLLNQFIWAQQLKKLYWALTEVPMMVECQSSHTNSGSTVEIPTHCLVCVQPMTTLLMVSPLQLMQLLTVWRLELTTDSNTGPKTKEATPTSVIS